MLLVRFDAEDTSKLTDTDGATFYVNQRVFARVENDERLKSWLAEHDMTDLLKVNSNSLSALAKEELEKHGKAPDGVHVSFRESVRILNKHKKRSD